MVNEEHSRYARLLEQMKIIQLDVSTFVDANRGNLGVLDNLDKIPFITKRVFFHYSAVANSKRGKHAHKSCRQLIIPVNGACKMHLINAFGDVSFDFRSGNSGILVPALTWVELDNMSSDFVALTLADQNYDASDYVFDLQNLLGRS